MNISSYYKKSGWCFASVLAGIVLAVSGSVSHAQNNAGQNSAGMEQDIQGLQHDVASLRLEVETLQKSNEDLQKQVLAKSDVQVIVDNAVAKSRSDIKGDTSSEITKANAALRKEVVDEMAKQIDALTKDFNAQLQKLADVIRAMPPAPVPVPSRRGATPSIPLTDDFPKDGGSSYIVKPGDTLAKIASNNHSTVQWILSANRNITDPKNIRAGETLYIPMKEPNTTGTPSTPTPPSGTSVTPVAPAASGQ
jgi:LysM repeat protein